MTINQLHKLTKLNNTNALKLVEEALGAPLSPRPLHYTDERTPRYRHYRRLTPDEARKVMALYYSKKAAKLAKRQAKLGQY